MPTWGQILNELGKTRTPQGVPDFDAVRRKYLQEIYKLTQRPVILYATGFLESRLQPVPPGDLQIGLLDLQGFMECMTGIDDRFLDLIILSPGGSAEAAESIVAYLRAKFDHIRVIVPIAAKSAATMLALAADEIVMTRHSQLGPIDPQFTIGTPEGPRSAPAQAILDQFELAKTECQNPANLSAWLPILRTYAPGLIVQCQAQRKLAEQMVAQWLAAYMFKGANDAAEKASQVAGWFADYNHFKSHGRPVVYDELQDLGLNVRLLEDDQPLQDAVLSVHHAVMHTFSGTAATKIIENHHGNAFVKLHMRGIIEARNAPIEPEGSAPGGARPEMNRQHRRASKARQRRRR
jgi:hypothetical protein